MATPLLPACAGCVETLLSQTAVCRCASSLRHATSYRQAAGIARSILRAGIGVATVRATIGLWMFLTRVVAARQRSCRRELPLTVMFHAEQAAFSAHCSSPARFAFWKTSREHLEGSARRAARAWCNAALLRHGGRCAGQPTPARIVSVVSLTRLRGLSQWQQYWL
jgi:hypothetical protein